MPKKTTIVPSGDNAMKIMGEAFNHNPADDAKRMLRNYVDNEIITDFSKIPEAIKLTLLQKTPKQFIEEREIAKGKLFHYVKHQYSKKALNFAFNFNVSNEVFNEQYYTYSEKYKDYYDPKCQKDSRGNTIPLDKDRDVTEAECTVKFTVKTENGNMIIRTVHASHKGFKNSATTRGDLMQSAISKAWTKCAQTFGIGADLEDDLYVNQKVEENDEIEDNSDFIDGDVVESSSKKEFTKW